MISTKDIMEFVHSTGPAGVTKQCGFPEGQEIGQSLGIRWDKFGVAQFTMGVNIELERRGRPGVMDITRDEMVEAGRTALMRLMKVPNYYSQLTVAAIFFLKAKESQTASRSVLSQDVFRR